MKRKRVFRVGDLRRLIVESLLQEQGNDVSTQETEDSLDAQVDRYLAQYESEAKTSKREGLDFRMMTRRILSEVEDDEEGGASEEPANEPDKLSLDDLDLESFANGVVRLIENYDSLLEVRNTLLRRARGFLAKGYEPDVVQEFERVMRESHGIADGESKHDIADEDFPALGADRAGDGGGAGGTSV